MNHLLLGAFVPFSITAIIYFVRRSRASLPMLVLTPVFMALTMTWAVAPDVPRLLGMTDFYYRLMLNPRCNIFFWHYSIDKVESPSAWFPLLFVLMWLLLLFAAWRELKIKEKDT